MMMKKNVSILKNSKVGIKEAVAYFDANYVLKEIDPHFSGSYDQPDFFRLLAIFVKDGNFDYYVLYSSPSFEACKRHLKFSYLEGLFDIQFDNFYFRIQSFKRHVLKDEWISSFDYVVKFKFERHEQLCEV